MQFQYWKFDKRIVKRNLQKGVITRDEYDAYVASLQDSEENATTDTDLKVGKSQDAEPEPPDSEETPAE